MRSVGENAPVDVDAAAPAPITDSQRRRSAALAVLMCALAVVGALSRVPLGGRPLAVCAQPALWDGVLVCDGNGAPAGARAWLAGQKLDVNRATEKELEQIPGVGPSLAHAILAVRTERGRFAHLSELDDVPGVGPKTLTKLSGFLEVR